MKTMQTRQQLSFFCRFIIYAVGLLLPARLAATPPPSGQIEETSPYNDYLLGTWGGIRPRLSAIGIDIEAVYTGEISGVATGGRKKGSTYLDNMDLSVSFDLDHLLSWSGTTVFLYGLANNGGNPSSRYAGDAQAFTNIEAYNTAKLYELWIQREWHEGRYSALFGLYDLNSEFDVRDTAALFLNSSQGIGPDFSQAGENGPSIFPTTSLALRLRWYDPASERYGQFAVFDGIPGDPDDPSGTRIDLDTKDGLLIAAEFGQGVSGVRQGKYALGAWGFTARFPDVRTGIARRGNWGLYALSEMRLYQEDDAEQGLGLTGRIGLADNRANQFAGFLGAGLVYQGLLPGRAEDQAGIGLTIAFNGSRFNDSQQDAGLKSQSAETALEGTYRFEALPFWAVQPSLQYIVNPGAVTGVDNALTFSLRTEASF